VQARGILLFSDEVYRGLEYDPADKLPPACDINPNAVSLGVMSKSYGLAGLRIGWIATQNTTVYDRMAALKDYTTICSSAPSEYLSELALRHREQIVERNLQIIRGNLSRLDEFFPAHGDRLEWVRPKAGPIAFPRLIGEDVEKFCHQLVSTAGVLLLPGTIYEHAGNHFRLGFARKNMPEALSRLEEYLDKQAG
jgi:aspartate/methionine/tyrosine aminotransferase